MSRYTTMTIGFLLVLIGIKFHMVESYLLTPRATKFWVERVGDSGNPVQGVTNNLIAQMPNGYNSGNAFQNNAYSPFNNSYNSYSNSGNRGYGAANDSVFQSASYQNQNTYQPRLAASQGMLARTMFGPQKQVTTPKWLGWPILFLGAVFILHGAGMRRS